MLSKAQEIEKIEAFAAELGPDSYLGPMLDEFLPMIKRDIGCDITPDLVDMTKRLISENARAAQEKKDLEAKIATLKTEISGLESSKRSLQNYLDNAKEQARSLIYGLQRCIG